MGIGSSSDFGLPRRGRWLRQGLSTALLIGLPCLLALTAYDSVAILLFDRGTDALTPAHDLSRSLLQDMGLTVLYMSVISPRVVALVRVFPTMARRASLVMLGLGLAWYEVLCAAASRSLSEPPGLLIAGIVLLLVPMLVAPWYVRWLKSRISDA